jgi:two-component system LytT family response regulator
MTRLRAIVVDDERLARLELRSMLAEIPSIEVVGEADSVDAAVALVAREEPDVVFLDVQMPEADGFELLERAGASFRVIFATAYDEHAIRAFEVNAIDYLLKPISPSRLARAVERLGAPEPPQPVRKLDYGDRLFITADDRPRLLKIDQIEHIRAAGDYSEVFTSDGKRLFVQKAMKEWEERLPETRFVRVHRSAIVNLECVERIEEAVNRSYLLYLKRSPEPIAMSRRYAGELRSRLS